MPHSELEDDGLVPIDEVGHGLGLAASAIRYYEERGLVEPSGRLAGRRWYGPAEIRRLAIIRYWQTAGLMSLEEIGDVLAGPAGTKGWTEVVETRMEILRVQIEQMEAARGFLEHTLTFHRDSSPDGCAHYEDLIWGDADGRESRHPHHAHARPAGRGVT
jgi:MerR family transcriptional regulator, copper efflux regulator